MGSHGKENNQKAPYVEEVILRGHIIDSLILPRVFDVIMDLGGDFEVEEIQVGRSKVEPSFARLRVLAWDAEQMRRMIAALQGLGAELVHSQDVRTEPAPVDGAAPDDFYSTTNLPTEVRMHGEWVPVEGTEMDLVIVVDWDKKRAFTRPLAELRRGDPVVVGHSGIRVHPLEREREVEVFSFMRSEVSSERPNRVAIHLVADEMRRIRDAGKRILFVVGPAVIHSGAGEYLARLIRMGYVNVLFGGNAIAVHDVENQLFGTSLGIDIKTGLPVPGGHAHHMRAINKIRQVGSLRAAVEQGILTAGVMYEAIRNNVELVLAGSIRDDGPIPDVITDVIEAQRAMRRALRDVEMAVMMATMLHSIATGNLLPAHVKVVVVDINPAVVTKLADRGSFQAAGLVTDAELFLRELCEELNG
ncbi:MAG: TIGR00300 family protein [Chloroflexi bacterium]|nr:TIGR00300 family protein [Chloroflexota bacterium]